MSGHGIGRRGFLLTVTGAAAVASTGIEGIVAAGRAPAYAQGTKLHWVRWVDFIPESDVELKRQMPDASKALGAEVTLETINANDLQPRITAAIQSGSGADIFNFQYNRAHLYQNAVVDVSDVAGAVAKAEGGFYDVWAPSCQVNGKWLSLPHSIVGNAVAYRKSWLKEAGATQYPKTWEEAHKLFTGMKKNGKRAVESVKFMQAFWKDACDEGGLAWDDTNNNRAFHAGEISATLNGASIYIVAKRQKDKLKDDKGEPLFQDIEHAALMPKGPAGQFALYGGQQHSIMKYSKNQKLAKDFLRWLHQDGNYSKWFEVNEGYSVGATKKWEEHPMWAKVDKPLQVFRQAARLTRAFGHPGPASAKATEAYTKYIIVDMYAKAAQGTKAEDAVKWAEGELKKIYEG